VSAVLSNTVLVIKRIVAYSSLCVCVRVQVPDITQCNAMFERTRVAFERTCRACQIVASVRTNVLLALERTSASCISIPKEVCIFLFPMVLINC
jgi:hypothetical protein